MYSPFVGGNVFRAWLLKTESSTGRDGGIIDELALRYIATIVAEPPLRERKPRREGSNGEDLVITWRRPLPSDIDPRYLAGRTAIGLLSA